MVEPFPAVHHQVSTITARLPERLHASNLLRELSWSLDDRGCKVPGYRNYRRTGTAATQCRCGSIGYLSFCGDVIPYYYPHADCH
ncbi:hypothetical protein ACNKHV_08695 [Shigella flexneri]